MSCPALFLLFALTQIGTFFLMPPCTSDPEAVIDGKLRAVTFHDLFIPVGAVFRNSL